MFTNSSPQPHRFNINKGHTHTYSRAQIHTHGRAHTQVTLRFNIDKGVSVMPGVNATWQIKENHSTPLDVESVSLLPLDEPFGVQGEVKNGNLYYRHNGSSKCPLHLSYTPC